jgi:uncharacterized protein (DUF885 family)
MNRFLRLPLVAVVLAISAPATADDVAARVKAFHALLDEQWEFTLKDSPEEATIIGDYRYNDRWSDFSLAHVQADKTADEDFLARFQAIDTSGFSEQDLLSQQLMVRQLKDNLAGIALKTYEMPEDQISGEHLQLADFIDTLPLDNTRHYQDYLARLHGIPRVVDQLIELMQQGEKDGLMPPKFLLEKAAAQAKDMSGPAGEANVFGHPVTQFPDGVPVADRGKLHDDIVAAVDNEVRPAYRKLADFMATDYAPKGRADPGIWALPDGAARYRYAIHMQTTTDRDPEEIHQLGMAQVKLVETQQTAIARKLGYKDLKAFRAELKIDPKVYATSRQEILDRYRKYIDGMRPELPKLFGLLPKTELKVLPDPEYREAEAAGAEYYQGTPDGSRPGIVYVNTGDYQHRSLLTVESTSYHEGVPGHHMQISIAQTLPGLPTFRQQASYNAYAEGWALYSERLGKDIGFYKDPYSDYGRLDDELLRACRLVLDTGVHYKHWSREQMVDFFRARCDQDEPTVQAETDRYISWPAQALGYKLGQLKILELRARARKALGAKFDIRAFHDEILNGGSLPLDVLEQRVDAWIAETKAGDSKLAESP